jgi:hypothetical protein
MYHTIEFRRGMLADLEISGKQPLERFRIHKGNRLRAQIKPRMVDTDFGPVEVADLFFEDGTVTRSVPFACFSFVE